MTDATDDGPLGRLLRPYELEELREVERWAADDIPGAHNAAKAYNLWCDDAECGGPGMGEAFDANTWPAWQTAAEVRAAAREQGWTRGRDGKDRCPEHSGRETR